MRAKFDQKIRKKLAEIAGLEEQVERLQQEIRDAKTYIQAIEDMKRSLPKGEGDSEVESDETHATLKEGSALAKARDVILKAGKPLHIDEILRQMGQEVIKKNRVSLAGSIAGYARKKRIFTKAAGQGNTFGLIGQAEIYKDNPPPTLSVVSGAK